MTTATWDPGDAYYQIIDGGKVEATLHSRCWNVGLFKVNVIRNYAELKEPKVVQFITREEYRAIVWPRRA